MEPQKSLKVKNGALVLIAIVISLAALKVCESVAIPIVLSLFAYFLLGPLLDRLDRMHVPHLLGIIICFLLVIVMIGCMFWICYQTISMLISVIPIYNDRLVALDSTLSKWLSKYVELPAGSSLISMIPINWKDLAVNSLSAVSSQFISIVKVCVLVLLYVLFLLLERQMMVPKLYAAFSGSAHGPMVAMMSERVSKQVSKYLQLKSVISFFTGLLFYLTAVVAGMDVPLLYGVLAFVFNFIPSIGSIIVTVLTILMAILQFAPHWAPVIFVALMCLSIEMILGNIIDPRLQGGQLNLSPVVILFSLAIWGYIWGIVGMFIAVPLTSCIEIVCANIQSMKPLAIILSGGKSFKRQAAQQKAMKKREKKGQPEEVEKENTDTQRADVILPDDFTNPKKK